jgi:hypothetical protein
MALIRLAMIELESGAWDAAQERAGELRAVGAKLGGEGSEGLIADAFEALARTGGGGDAKAAGALTAALDTLERADAKAMLAYSLTMAAEIAIAARAFVDGAALAARALAAATPLGKPSALILAHAALGQAAMGSGRAAEARTHLETARGSLGHPYGVARRARDAVDRLTAALSNAGTNAAAHAGATKKTRR